MPNISHSSRICSAQLAAPRHRDEVGSLDRLEVVFDTATKYLPPETAISSGENLKVIYSALTGEPLVLHVKDKRTG